MYISYLFFGFGLTAFKYHTGATLAKVFQAMLRRNGLNDRILACNNNNAASNNTQAIVLAKLPNMFEEINHVCCFNHTLQLSAKTLLKPFNVALADGRNNHAEDDVPDLEEVDNEESAEDGSKDNDDGDDDCDDDSDPDSALDFGGADDGVNELDMLPSDEREDTFEQMSDVRDTVTKVCPFFYLATNLLVNFLRSIIWCL